MPSSTKGATSVFIPLSTDAPGTSIDVWFHTGGGEVTTQTVSEYTRDMALTGDRSFRDEVVRLASLTVTSNMLDGYTFSNCQIIGPAVLAILDDNEISHCSFSGPIEAIMWVVDPSDRPMVVGAVGVTNCTFSGCDFRDIGFAGPPELKRAFEGATTD